MMKKLTIDGIGICVEEDATILDAAKKAGVKIPTLCYLEDQSEKANCRICLVEVKGGRGPVPACATKVAEGMEVLTRTPELEAVRRENLQLILTHHPIACQSCVRLGNSSQCDLSQELCDMCFYCDCVRDGDCELQALAKEYDVNGMEYEWELKTMPVDTSAHSFVKDPSKCIQCRRCVSACGEIQGIYTWSITERGFQSSVQPAGGVSLADSPCVECGQCVRSCPVGALFEKQDLDSLPVAAAKKGQVVIARAEQGFLNPFVKLSGLDPAKITEKNLAAGLHRIGVDVVVGNAMADEAVSGGLKEELMERLETQKQLPLISAACPSAVRYLATRYPGLKSCLAKTTSAQELFGRWAKEKWGGDAYTVSLTSCSAKKMEGAASTAVDLVMSPREMKRVMHRNGADLNRLPAVGLDEPGRQVWGSGEDAQKAGIRTRQIQIGGRTIQMACACGLRAVRELLEQVCNGKCEYQYIQLEACPKGCVSAQGLPFEVW